MHIEHIAIWTHNLEKLIEFYVAYLQARANAKYVNSEKQFESYFLTFSDGGARLELMNVPTLIKKPLAADMPFTGYTHFALSVGSRRRVNALTEQLLENGFQVISGPRETGDGYYESCILDPDGNQVEITA